MNPYTFDFAAVYHTPDGVYAYPLDIDTLCIRIRTAKSDCLCVHIRFKDVYDHVILPERKRMELIRSDKYYDYYETEIRNKNKRFKYFFELTDRSGNVWDYSYSEFKEHDDEYNEFYFYPYLFAEEVPDPPEWVIGGMIYQIFIDRFRNGDISNDPADRLAWNELPSSKSFYGGDLKGITEKMEYIASLGANMIYVNPIFLSDSNHKYDTIDYYTIDPCFGSVEDACDMVRQAHRFGIRVILDAVFNHCSNKNSIFQDVVANGHNSDHYDWFSVDGNSIKISPHNYDTFAAQVPEMPRLNTSNPRVQDYLADVAVYWTGLLDIDGWRLDVADEVSHVLWKKLRARLREVKPDIYILGEVWNRAAPWLMGDEFDSVTNYRFRKTILTMAKNDSWTNEDFWDQICFNEMNYRSWNLPYMVNLLSSHDVKRIMTEMNGCDELVRALLGVMMTYPGIPLLYYGDEIGIEGGEDPDNRRTMKWNEKGQEPDMLVFVRKISAFRRSSDAVRFGGIKPLRGIAERVIGFERVSSDGKKVIVLANLDNAETLVVCDSMHNSVPKAARVLKSALDDRSFDPVASGVFEIKLKEYDFLVLSSG